MGADPQPSPGEQLLAAYRQWRALEADPPGRTASERSMSHGIARQAADGIAKQVATAVDLARVERRAHRKGVHRVARESDRGRPPADALAAGWRRYRRHGGQLTLAAWRRKVAQGGRP